MQPFTLMYNKMFQLGKKLTIVKYSTLLNNSFHPICIPTGENQKVSIKLKNMPYKYVGSPVAPLKCCIVFRVLYISSPKGR